MSDIPIGFCAWNDFQVAQHYHVARQTPHAELIVYPNPTRPQRVSDAVIAEVDLPVRVLPHVKSLTALAGSYGAYVFQNRPPMMAILEQTRIVMLQYSMSKAATAYNLRWGTADLGLVYGNYSAEMLSTMCPVVPIGNPRLDPYFQGGLCEATRDEIASQINPEKPTLLYAPTWGDLSSVAEYEEELSSLSDLYNVLLHPHHLHAPIESTINNTGLLTKELPGGINKICYLLKLCDVIVTDYSGIAFDALAVGKPLVLLNVAGVSVHSHKKLHERGLEFDHRNQMGVVVTTPADLKGALRTAVSCSFTVSDEMSSLRLRCFSNLGSSGKAGAKAIMQLMAGEIEKSDAQQYLSHGIIESFRMSESHNKRLHSFRKATKLAKAESAKWRHLAKTNRHFLLRLYQRGIRATIAAVKAIGRPALSRSSSLQALHKRMPYYRARQSVILQRLLAEAFDALQADDYVTARSRFQRVLEFDPEHRDAHYNLFVIEAWAGDLKTAAEHRRSAGSLGHLGDEPTRFLCRNSLMADGLISAEMYVTRSAESKPRGLRGFRVITSAFPFPDRVRVQETRRVVDIVRSELETGDFTNFKRLVQLGFVADVESLAMRHENVEVRSYLRKVTEHTKSIDWLLNAAGRNELVVEGARQVYEITTGSVAGLADNFVGSFVELFIPDSFLSPFGEDGWGEPRHHTLQMWHTIVTALGELDLLVVPRLQTSFYAHSSSRAAVTISHHTVGTSAKNLRIKLSAFPGFFTVDAKGYSGWAEFRQRLYDNEHRHVPHNQAENQWKSLYSDFVLNGVTKFPQNTGTTGTSGDYIFVPLQVADDTVSSLAHMSQAEFLAAAAAGAMKAGISLVIKRHPLCKSYRIQKLLQALRQSARVEISDAAIHSLIGNSVGVVTVNSGVGFEALVHLKSVITVGDADYDAATVQIKTPDALTETLSERKWEFVDIDDRKKWLSYVFQNVLVASSDVEAMKRRILIALSAEQRDHAETAHIANVS